MHFPSSHVTATAAGGMPSGVPGGAPGREKELGRSITWEFVLATLPNTSSDPGDHFRASCGKYSERAEKPLEGFVLIDPLLDLEICEFGCELTNQRSWTFIITSIPFL
jgi:hypothetical protein